MAHSVYIVLAGLMAVGILHGAEQSLLSSRVEALDDGAGYRRTTLVNVGRAKYPIRRIEEIHEVDPANGVDRLVKRSRMVGDHVIVKLLPDATRRDLERLTARMGAVVRRKMYTPRLFLVALEVPDLDAVSCLVASFSAATDIVEYAEPDFLLELCDTIPNEPSYPGSLWGHVKIDCSAAWDYATGTGGVVVAVIDTGIDYNHVDLASNIWANPGETGIDTNGVGMATNGIDDDANGLIDDVYGWDFYNDDNDPMDDHSTSSGHSHGTRGAGTIGAVGNNGLGVVGVCWNVKLMALKMYSSSGRATMSDAVDCFNYAATMRMKGINVRITSNSWLNDEYAASMDEAVQGNRDVGILCVAAAGNQTGNVDITPVYPACFDLDNVISVTGTDQSDNLYSGDVGFGITSVDLAAPAVDILSTTRNNGYDSSSGTSRSVPFVAGTAALLWELMPSLTYLQVRQAIFDGVDPVTSLQTKVAAGGRLNAHKALLQIHPVIRHTALINTTNTTSVHDVEAEIIPFPLLPANRQWLYWNLDGSTNVFTTNRMVHVTNDTYLAGIPAQPLGTSVHYYLRSATTNGLVATDPTNAPGALHTFGIVEALSVSVTGSPVQVGRVFPDYGEHLYPSGIVVSASSEVYVDAGAGMRYAVDGWNGSGSIPASGESNSVAFTLSRPSTCEWVWSTQYRLNQMSSVSGLIDTSTWWYAASTGWTVTAVSPALFNGTNYGLGGWYIDGVRQPDETSAIVNPVMSVTMDTQRFAQAFYLPGNQDGDLDDMADYWEFAYFGSLSQDWTNDHDGDMMPDGAEMVAGTDPRDGSDLLSITLMSVTNAGTNIVIQWASVSNRTYSISARPDISTGTWMAVTGDIPAVEPLNTVTTRVNGERVMFYRVGVGE